MPSALKSTASFVRALGVPFAAFAAAIEDPFRWLVQAGIVTAESTWIVSVQWRQFGLLVFAFVWLAVWYHRQLTRFEDEQPPRPDMPLHEVVQYIAKDSEWAARFPANLDDKWVIRTDRELMSQLMMGHIQAFGRLKKDRQPMENGLSVIPPGFFNEAQWHSGHMVTSDPPTHMWRSTSAGGGVYINVMLNRRQVEIAWPRRSPLRMLAGRSPIDRYNRAGRLSGQTRTYKTIFAEQNANHAALLNGTNPLAAIDEVLAEAG